MIFIPLATAIDQLWILRFDDAIGYAESGHDRLNDINQLAVIRALTARFDVINAGNSLLNIL
jgi:hypothetical protein